MISYRNLTIHEKINFICQNLQALVALIGIIGNVLTIFIFGRKMLKKFSYSFYWKVLAYSDLVVLFHSFRHWFKFILGVDIDTFSRLSCRFNEYQPYVASSVSLWLLALISLDRLVTVVYPKRFALIKRRSVQLTLILLIIVYSVLLNLSLPLNSRLIQIRDPKSNTTKWVCFTPGEVLGFNSIVMLANIVVVNIVINAAINVRMISFLFMSRRACREHRSVAKYHCRSKSALRDQKFAISAVGLNFSSFVLKLPLVIGICLPVYWNYNEEKIQMVVTICLSVAILDNSDLFFINIAVNSIFYREFLVMIGFRKSRREILLSESTSMSKSRGSHR